MLTLKSIRNDNDVFRFLGGQIYTVGRKNSDVTLPGDNSISRKHATIRVEFPRSKIENLSIHPTLVVMDVGSKFGTFVGDEVSLTQGDPNPINPQEAVRLTHDSRIRFGRQWNVFRCEYTPLVVTCSTLQNAMEFKDIIHQLGGHIQSMWTAQCSYVCMSSVTLTVKAVCALLSGGYIVSPDYFRDYIKAVVSRNPQLPNPIDYIPPLAEANLSNVNFCPIPARATLFRGKTFLFYNNKQMEKLAIIIQAGGGQSKLLAECRDESDLCSPDHLLIFPPSDTIPTDNQIIKLADMYKSRGKRLIQESEISRAAIYVNITYYCNSKCPPGSLTSTNFAIPSQTQPSSFILESQSSAETQRSFVQPSVNIFEESGSAITTFSEGSRAGTQGTSRYHQAEISSTSGYDRYKRRIRTSPISEASTSSNESQLKRQKFSTIGSSTSSSVKNKTLNSLFKMSDSDDSDEEDISSRQSQQQQQISSATSSTNSSSTGGRGNSSSVNFVPGTPYVSPVDSPMFPGLVINSSDMSTKSSNDLNLDSSPDMDREKDTLDDLLLRLANHPTTTAVNTQSAELPTFVLPTLPTAEMPTLILPQARSSRRKIPEMQNKNSASTSARKRTAPIIGNDVNEISEEKRTKLDIIETKPSATVVVDMKPDGAIIDLEKIKKRVVDVKFLFKPAPVVFRSLIRKDRPSFPLQSQNPGVDGGVVNFKRFVKVWPLTRYDPIEVKEKEKRMKNSVPVPSTAVRLNHSQRPPPKKNISLTSQVSMEQEEKEEEAAGTSARKVTQKPERKKRNPPPPRIMLQANKSKRKPAVLEDSEDVEEPRPTYKYRDSDSLRDNDSEKFNF